MELTRSSLRIIVDGRPVTAEGEAFLPGYGSPDFVVYQNSITRWDDGEIINKEMKEKILRQITEEARLSNINIEIE